MGFDPAIADHENDRAMKRINPEIKRAMETVTWQVTLYSLQAQLRLAVHVGALTVLKMSGNSRYVRFARAATTEAGPPRSAARAGCERTSLPRGGSPLARS